MKKIKWCNVIVPVVGIVLLFTLLRPCRGSDVMKCNYSVYAAVILFSFIALENMLALLTKEKNFSAPLMSVLAASVNIAVPAAIIGGCMMPGMACRAKSFPGIYVCSIIIIIFGILELSAQLLQKRKRGYKHET